MRQPAIFIGHGTPMNAIEDNEFTRSWQSIGKRFNPKAILMISAHWVTNGSKIQETENLKKINDMGGFPKALYDLVYPAKGDIELSRRIQKNIASIKEDNSWGLDHGVWSILTHMYPDADIPIVQLSLDKNLSAKEHYALGQQLSSLREEGVMIIGSGNIVHSFEFMDMSNEDGYPFAQEFDQYIHDAILNDRFDLCISYNESNHAKKAVPTTEHFDPLLYILGAAERNDVEVYNKKIVFGGFSMTSYLFI